MIDGHQPPEDGFEPLDPDLLRERGRLGVREWLAWLGETRPDALAAFPECRPATAVLGDGLLVDCLDPVDFEDSAVLEHEPVHRFGTDLAITLAPFVGNSILAFGAFAVADATAGTANALAIWLGVCFGFTALPSITDTETLLVTVASVPNPLAPLGSVVAHSLRGLTRSAWVSGPVTFVWTLVLLSGSAGLV